MKTQKRGVEGFCSTEGYIFGAEAVNGSKNHYNETLFLLEKKKCHHRSGLDYISCHPETHMTTLMSTAASFEVVNLYSSRVTTLCLSKNELTQYVSCHLNLYTMYSLLKMHIFCHGALSCVLKDFFVFDLIRKETDELDFSSQWLLWMVCTKPIDC